MAVYRFSKCGNCGDRFENMAEGGDSAYGPPFIKCSSCNHLNKTKYTLWRDLSILKKISVMFGQIVRLIMYGIGGIVASIVIAYHTFIKSSNGFDSNLEYMLSINNWFAIILFLLVILGLLYLAKSEIKGFFNLFKTFKYQENLYDKNKGFLWSYEWFD